MRWPGDSRNYIDAVGYVGVVKMISPAAHDDHRCDLLTVHVLVTDKTIKAWACRFEKEEGVAAKRQICPECNEPRLIPEGDYICSKCRKEEGDQPRGKFKVMIPAAELGLMSRAQLLDLVPKLVAHGIGFTVEPDDRG